MCWYTAIVVTLSKLIRPGHFVALVCYERGWRVQKDSSSTDNQKKIALPASKIVVKKTALLASKILVKKIHLNKSLNH